MSPLQAEGDPAADLRAELAGYSDLPGLAKLKLLETQGGLLVFYIDLNLYFSIFDDP